MRRVFILLSFLMLIVPVFAFTPTQNNDLQVLGYYDPTSNSSVRLSIYDYQGSQMYYASNVQVSSDHLGSAEEIFNWEFEGDLNGTATVRFTFTEMQAYLNNKYYRPAYTIAHVLNTTKVNGANVNNDGFAFSASSSSGLSNNRTITKTKTTQSYMFENTAVFVFSGTRTNNRNATWLRSGYFTLNITDYDNVTGGDFRYRINVTVEYEAL